MMTAGEILVTQYLNPAGITVREFAEEADLSIGEVSAVCHEGAPISEEMADRLEAMFGKPITYWLSLPEG